MIEQVQAIGFVEALRTHAEDDFWGGEEACISLTEDFTVEALRGLADFSHVEVLFLFHEVKPVMKEFLPRQEVRQPAWSHEIMRQYWLPKSHNLRG